MPCTTFVGIDNVYKQTPTLLIKQLYHFKPVSTSMTSLSNINVLSTVHNMCCLSRSKVD